MESFAHFGIGKGLILGPRAQFGLGPGQINCSERTLQAAVPWLIKVFFSFSEQIATNLSMEIRRLQKRKQLHFPGCSSPPPSASSSQENVMESSSVPSLSTASSTALFNALSPNKRDIPLFTFKQVSLICERMIKERETQIREEYNNVLTCKMAGKESGSGLN